MSLWQRNDVDCDLSVFVLTSNHAMYSITSISFSLCLSVLILTVCLSVGLLCRNIQSSHFLSSKYKKIEIVKLLFFKTGPTIAYLGKVILRLYYHITWDAHCDPVAEYFMRYRRQEAKLLLRY